ncbi:MAG: reprolysin-like metallopeptidase [Planctomycetota bacterium]|jgi:hypothetical protein
MAADVAAQSQDGLWLTAPKVPQVQVRAEPWVRPNVFQGVHLDRQALAGTLAAAPMEFTDQAREAPLEITLPMPDGTFALFHIVEAPIMEPALAVKFPEIKTYRGYGVDDPAATVRLDWTPAGFHAQVLSPNGAVYIDPYTKGDTGFYASYHKSANHILARDFQCLTEPDRIDLGDAPAAASRLASGETLQTYRLAVAATGEYTQFHGGTVPAGMAAIVTAVNRVTGVYEVDVAVRMVLVANNDLVVYTNGYTDPYSNGSGYQMLGQNQTNLDAVIGPPNYDIGHVFSTGGGGVAYLRVPCTSSYKARGVTGLPQPTGDAFYIDYVAHEMGHQFGGNHTFNGIGLSCAGGNRYGPAAYEPGSGSTIMAYAGICGPNDDLQNHSDPYFHSESYREIRNFVTGSTGSSCAVLTATGNNPPIADAGPDYTIPVATPFTLTASGSDPDHDNITYCWEERDLGPAQRAGGMVDNGSSPIFRSFNPTIQPWRIFPRLYDIVNNMRTIGEVFPTTSRALDFRVLVRDNRGDGGGVAVDDMTVEVDGSRGPFRVTSPNTPVVWSGQQTVTWDVAGTDGGLINVSEVNILLSTSGGYDYPTELALNTPNDGAEEITLPDIQSSSARIMVQAVGNIFFDISDSNFIVDVYSMPVEPPSPYNVKKNRFISFDPNNATVNVAFEVSLIDGPGPTGALGWVGEPYDPGCFNDDGTPTERPCINEFVARVVPDPVFRAWPEQVVYVGDCEIVPAAMYGLRTTSDGVTFAPPFEVSTIDKPGHRFHGDIVGVFGTEYSGPNSVVNVSDVQAMVFCIEELAGAPHITWCELHGLGAGSPPNFIHNVSDLQQLLKGFEGLTFLESNPDNRDPADCP